MIFTKKSDYGLRAVLELAASYGRGPLSAREIAQRGGLPDPFVRKLLQRLAEARIVEAARGRRGGYALTKDPEDISLLEVLEAFEDLAPVRCLQHPPAHATGKPSEAEVEAENPCAAEVEEERCPARAAWTLIDRRLRQALRTITLAELLRDVQAQGFRLGLSLHALTAAPQEGGLKGR